MSDLTAHVEILKMEFDDDVWRIRLIYSNGDVFLSKKTYPTKEEAERAALEWAAENVDESRLGKQ